MMRQAGENHLLAECVVITPMLQHRWENDCTTGRELMRETDNVRRKLKDVKCMT